jgi:hypothetical protein
MKKFISIVMMFIIVMSLSACSTAKNSNAEYSFYGESNEVAISNGAITITDTKSVFSGGNLKIATIENFENIISYCVTFYTIIDDKETPIHVESMNNTSNIVLLDIHLVKIEDTDLNVIKTFERIEEIKSNFWCNVEITNSNNESKIYKIPLTLIEITE